MIIAISGKQNSGKDLVGKTIQYLTNQELSYEKTPNGSKITSFEEYLKLDKKYNFSQNSDWKIKKFATSLKQIVSILTGISVEDLEKEEVKSRELGEEWDLYQMLQYGDDTFTSEKEAIALRNTFVESAQSYEIVKVKMTVRKLLQELGTDLFRNQLHPDIFVNALFSDYNKTHIDYKTNRGILRETKYPSWLITDLRFENELQAVKEREGITIRVNRYTGNVAIDNDTHTVTDWQHKSETALDTYPHDYVINNNGEISELIGRVKQILIKEQIL